MWFEFLKTTREKNHYMASQLHIIPLTKAKLHGDETVCYKWVNITRFPTSLMVSFPEDSTSYISFK